MTWLKSLILVVLVVSGLSQQTDAWAHGGGLDAAGCHNDRAAGEYHCHGARRASVASSAPKVKRTRVANSNRSGTKARYRPAAFSSSSSATRARASSSEDFCACSRQRKCTGPRGGVYCINGSGNKSYLPRG